MREESTVAHYLVRANPETDRLDELKEWLDSGEIGAMRPFGGTLEYSLRNARLDADGRAVWEEEDYCRPPLRMEREAVLDTYFTELEVERVAEGDGWEQIEDLPSLWDDRDL